MGIAQEIDLPFLSQYFHLPINDVAKEIGVCATVLKKICRKNGIPRWPHRKIKSLDKMIMNLEQTTPKNTEEELRIGEEIMSLRSKKAYLIKHPNILAIKSPMKKEVDLLQERISENELANVASPPLSSINFGYLTAAASAAASSFANSPMSSPAFSSTSPVMVSRVATPLLQREMSFQSLLNSSLSSPSLPNLSPCHTPVLSRQNSADSLSPFHGALKALPTQSPHYQDAYPIHLPKLNLPDVGATFTLKTLEPSPMLPSPIQEVNGLSPLSQSAAPAQAPLPAWFKAEHESIVGGQPASPTKMAVESTTRAYPSSSSVIRVDQLIQEDDQVPSPHLSPLCFE
ncbi:hypothetical protein SAMD00019534_006930 [Acytostelium subglobosum LB1]|uniref:hypothetical protein n=1 Tax=Acytostelium subglobosum LB1 TaxID=1410327 RepID=UPI000645154E|nr:hypothetical protein SAMD00019534_006930 [Acytostelium subglobosum LB1]GAM17518.1 hypothetical protein SAMD00019534_006930 [Acytostelium subglobosum LB1]|eukprot:XP_012759580.1 hypothetical protein SAMD00019534_006930 [Acytostelium subglobosum LB1]